MSRRLTLRASLALLTAGSLCFAPPAVAHAVYPGANGRIALVSGGPSDPYDIFVVRPNGQGLRDLTPAPAGYDQHPAWSPDGTEIAFDSDRAGGPESPTRDIYVMAPDGSNVRRLGPDGLVEKFEPAWSPDGTTIACAGYQSNGRGGIYTIRALDARTRDSCTRAMTPSGRPTGNGSRS